MRSLLSRPPVNGARADDAAPATAELALLRTVVEAVGAARTRRAVVASVLDALRHRSGWAYAACWDLRAEDASPCLLQESGRAPAGLPEPSGAAARERTGLVGLARRGAEPVLVRDLAELTGCTRATAAARAGLRAGAAVPLTEGGRVTAVLELLGTGTAARSADDDAALRSVGLLVSGALERLAAEEREADATRDADASSTVLRALSCATTSDEALSAALDTIRRAFGWAYGSYWAVDEETGTLRFRQESGEAGAEFREVTATASFAEGVGLAGRAWQAGDLVFVGDLADVTDCVRAPAARRAGVRSGVCLPVTVAGRVVGTMDFFVTERVTLSPGREHALRNTAVLVGQALERFAAAERLAVAGRELVASIEEVERNVLAATTVAQDGQRLTEDADREVTALGESSTQISKVVQVIQAIAAQTNLLALNATIEAARRGGRPRFRRRRQRGQGAGQRDRAGDHGRHGEGPRGPGAGHRGGRCPDADPRRRRADHRDPGHDQRRAHGTGRRHPVDPVLSAVGRSG